MKNLFLIFLIVFVMMVLLSCSMDNLKEKEIIRIVEKETVETGGMKLIQVFPAVEGTTSLASLNTIPGVSFSSIAVKKDKDADFDDGIVYDENANPTDGLIHDLNLSTLLGNKPGEIFLYCEWLDGADDEIFQVFFKPYGLDVDYVSVTVGYGIKKQLLNIVTNEDSKIQFYHDYMRPFDGRIPTSDPDYYDWNAISFRIMIYYYDNGGSINL